MRIARPRAYHYLTFGICLVVATLAAPATAQLTNRFYEGFELPQALDDWIVDNGTWEIGVPAFGPPLNPLNRRAFAGTNVAATVLAGNYPDDTSSRLISPAFVVPPANHNPRLRLWHWFSFHCGDYGYVQIKVGAGPWVTL